MEEVETLSKASVESEPVVQTTGPYWQMAYYAVSGFFFWAILIILVPFVDVYFGGAGVIFYITFSYGLCSNIVRLVLIYYSNGTKKSTGSQMKSLIIFGASLTGLTMAAFPLSMSVLGPDNGNTGFWVCIVLSSGMGVFNSLLMNAGFGLMSMAPEKSAAFFLLGQTMTSVLAWPVVIALREIIYALGGSTQTGYYMALVALLIASLITIGAIPLYLLKTQHHPVFANLLESSRPIIASHTILEVLKIIRVPAGAGWLSGVLTFMVFPSQVGLWVPFGGSAPYDTALYRSFLIYIYSVSDTIGRALPRFFPGMKNIADRPFILGTIMRGVILVPLILLSSTRSIEFLAYDWMRLVLIALFGISNGANFALSNILGPAKVEPSDKMHAGTILSFTAINGLFVGSLIGIGIKQIING